MSQFPTDSPFKEIPLQPTQPQGSLDCAQLQVKINDLTLQLASSKKSLENYNADRQASLKTDIDLRSNREDGLFKPTVFDKLGMELGLVRGAETGSRFNRETTIKKLERDLSTTQEEYNLKCGRQIEDTRMGVPKNDSTKQLIYVGLGIVAIIIVAKVLTKK